MVKAITDTKTAHTLWDKGLGVIGWKDFGKYEGLLLPNSNAIHTFFVRFSIDVAFLDKDYKIVQIVEGLRPWSFSPIVWHAKHTLELPLGGIKKHKLAVGDTVNLK